MPIGEGVIVAALAAVVLLVYLVKAVRVLDDIL